ncbi:hypothetical protein SAMN05192553_101541 [Cyclobacterium xiamenense]|uniref:Uncharacterized protein n=1 Tax=Cyclobacterium xiamenense TaxID=1297121 RepID=A0A1H6TZ02_9BACT|nr:hypothetical protein SAMN05192553_101541 [Cyclobacterium xiamenense]
MHYDYLKLRSPETKNHVFRVGLPEKQLYQRAIDGILKKNTLAALYQIEGMDPRMPNTPKTTAMIQLGPKRKALTAVR